MPVPALFKIAALPAVKHHGNLVMGPGAIMGQQFQQGFPAALEVHGIQELHPG